jgi:peptidoglycan/LPS O-acetylase OafA/YrhL
VLAVLFLACGVISTPPAGHVWLDFRAVKIASDLFYGLAFFIVVNVACHYERVREGAFVSAVSRALSALGERSYSVYLVHNPLMVGLKRVAVGAGLGVLSITSLRLFVAVVGGLVFFRFVESRWLKKSRPSTRRDAEGTQPALE